MKKNKGITMVALVITIVLLLILAGISIGTGGNIIKRTELENLKTGMLLIEVKGKEYVENANFNLGTGFEKLTDETEKSKRIDAAKSKLKGKEITDASQLPETFEITTDQFNNEKNNLEYYYELSDYDLEDMGMANEETKNIKGDSIIKYDIKDNTVEVYNTQGFTKDDKTYYKLSDLRNLEV